MRVWVTTLASHKDRLRGPQFQPFKHDVSRAYGLSNRSLAETFRSVARGLPQESINSDKLDTVARRRQARDTTARSAGPLYYEIVRQGNLWDRPLKERRYEGPQLALAFQP